MSEHSDAGTAIKCRNNRAGGAKAALLNSRQWSTLKMDAMDSYGTAKSRMTAFLQKIVELFRSLGAMLYALPLWISKVVSPVIRITISYRDRKSTRLNSSHVS